MARLKLEFDQDRPARLDPQTKARFRTLSEADIEALAGDGEHEPSDDLELKAAHRARRLKMIRQSLELTQDGLGQLLRIPLATVRDWEQGRREPDAAADTLLRVLEREPEAVRRAMAND